MDKLARANTSLIALPAVLLGILALGFGWMPHADRGPDSSVLQRTNAPSGAPPTVAVQEWDVPWAQTRPRDPDVAPDGTVWFVGQVGHYLASFDPDTEAFTKFDLENGTGPHSVNVASDGMVWYTGNKAAHIGRLDPASGDIEKFPTPSEGASDPHTHRFTREGDMWFTNQWGNTIGRLSLPDGTVELIDVPIDGARPYGMDLDSDGRPWIALLGTNKLATVDPETTELRTVDIPWDGARPRRLAVGSDDRIYFVDYARGRVGIYDPAGESFESWVTPSGRGSAPYGMTIDRHDRVYFVETGVSPNQFVGFDPASEEFFAVEEIPSGGGTIRNMRYDPERHAVWFGTDANTIGRAQIQESETSG